MSKLIIRYVKGPTIDQDQYPWSVQGAMPITQLVGYITRVQAELAFRSPESCDEVACIIDYTAGLMTWCVHDSIPVDALVGALELVKAMLVGNQLAGMMQRAQQAAQTGLLDPSGKPIMRGM